MNNEIEFIEFINFIVWNGIELEDTLCFINLQDYKVNDFEKAIFKKGEEVWSALECALKMDYNTIEKSFKGIKHQDDDTIVAEFNDNQEYIIFAI